MLLQQYPSIHFVAGASPSCLGARAGYTVDKSPAHHQRGYQLHIRSNLGFSILLKDTSTWGSAQPGAGIWTSNLPITNQPALPPELQPPSSPGTVIINFAISCQKLCISHRLSWQHYRSDQYFFDIMHSWLVSFCLLAILRQLCSQINS